MVTGIEIAGLILASLPFFAKSLSAYTEGIETLSHFGDKSYQRQQRKWRATLGGQSAVLKDTIIKILDGLIEDEEDIFEMLADSHHNRWKDENLDLRLRNRLKENYMPIKDNMQVVLESIEGMQRRLGPVMEEDRKDISSNQIWVHKFKNIFSNDIYETLLSNITDANLLLQTLLSIQSQEFEGDKNGPRSNGKLLKLVAGLRKHASSLHNILFHQQKWTCQANRHNHILNLRLDHIQSKISGSFHRKLASPSTIIFLCQDLANDDSQVTLQHSWLEHVLEAEVVEITQETLKHDHGLSGQDLKPYMTRRRALSIAPVAPPGKRQKTVAFVESTSGYDEGPMQRKTRPTSDAAIIDLCSTIMESETGPEGRKYLGYLMNRLVNGQLSDLYLKRAPNLTLPPRSLHEILRLAGEQKRDLKPPVLRKLDCALMAVILASNILRLQGNWLRPDWTLQDVVLSELTHPSIRNHHDQSPLFAVENLYLTCTIPNEDFTRLHFADMDVTNSSEAVHCPTLFPLGLALVEVALYRPLSDIPAKGTSEEFETDTAALNLKKAKRVLPWVSEQMGDDYRDVIFDFLWWPLKRPQDGDLESIEFQKAVMDYVVLPLMDVWKALCEKPRGRK